MKLSKHLREKKWETWFLIFHISISVILSSEYLLYDLFDYLYRKFYKLSKIVYVCEISKKSILVFLLRSCMILFPWYISKIENFSRYDPLSIKVNDIIENTEERISKEKLNYQIECTRITFRILLWHVDIKTEMFHIFRTWN